MGKRVSILFACQRTSELTTLSTRVGIWKQCRSASCCGRCSVGKRPGETASPADPARRPSVLRGFRGAGVAGAAELGRPRKKGTVKKAR